MPKVNEYRGIKVGDVVEIVGVAAWRGHKATVLSIETEAGARNGWYDVAPDGFDRPLTFAGEELKKCK